MSKFEDLKERVIEDLTGLHDRIQLTYPTSVGAAAIVRRIVKDTLASQGKAIREVHTWSALATLLEELGMDPYQAVSYLLDLALEDDE